VATPTHTQVARDIAASVVVLDDCSAMMAGEQERHRMGRAERTKGLLPCHNSVEVMVGDVTRMVTVLVGIVPNVDRLLGVHAVR
jgi:hypothetical protein